MKQSEDNQDKWVLSIHYVSLGIELRLSELAGNIFICWAFMLAQVFIIVNFVLALQLALWHCGDLIQKDSCLSQ